jgi:superfamily II DNA helicase RecQ
VEKRLIDGERGTGWLFLVEFGDEHRNQNNQNNPSAPKVDYREILSEQEYALFDRLRTTRKELAEKQGVPVYAVFTNDQLANMIKNKAKTIKELTAVPGIGEARAKQYGETMLKVLAEHTANEAPELSL